MSEEMDNLLGRVTPRGASPESRARVLALVADELKLAPCPRRRTRLAWVVVGGIIAATAANVYLNERQQARLTELYGPEPPAAALDSLIHVIESTTDAETAQWFARRVKPTQGRNDVNLLRREQAVLAASLDS